MKVWKEGERSVGLCERCKKRVETRFVRQSVALESPKVAVDDVLVEVCERCGELVSIPCQSSPKLNEARTREIEKFEARIPAELEDSLGLITLRYAGRLDSFRGALLRYYLYELGKSRDVAERVKSCARECLALGKLNARVSFRVEGTLLESACKMARSVGISDKSEMIRGIIVAALEDSRNPTPKRKAVLEALAAAAAV